MDFLIDNWLLVLLAVASGAMLFVPALGAGGSHKVTPAEAVRLINREKGVLIDLSEAAEYAAGHAAGAKNVPLSALDGHKALPSNKATPLILTCASGVRSGRAVARLKKLGYEKVSALGGGNRAWADASLPTEREGDPAQTEGASRAGDKPDGKASGKANGKGNPKAAAKQAAKPPRKPADKPAEVAADEPADEPVNEPVDKKAAKEG